MKSVQVLIQSQSLEPLGKPSARVVWEENPRKVSPGQALLVYPPGSQMLAALCMPIQIRSDGLLLEPPEDETWSLGDRLEIWGPIGNSFNPPQGSRKWLLLAPVQHAGRLLPLVEAGLEKGASVALWSQLPPPQLPPAVELLADPQEAQDWAEYIAVDLGESDRIEAGMTGLENLKATSASKVEVLLTPPMPCGFGGCGLCAVKARRGWRLACMDGPVFDWNDLEL
jgi:hypothetical protein